jgi:hypothetical protein
MTYVSGMGIVLCLISPVGTATAEEWASTGHMTVDGRLVAGGHNQLYGLEVDHLNIDANTNYVYALMTLVSNLQNGEIPPGQMRWLHERAIMSAVPRNIIEEYMAFQHRTAKLEDHMIGSGGDSIARVLLYDVTQMITHGDLYDNSPRQLSEYDGLFSQASQQLVVSTDVSAQIQNVVDQEVDLLDRKKVIFWEDTPYTPPNVIDTTIEEEWASTGHMTVDGRLVAGGHNQLYGLNVDYLDIDANTNYVYALMTLVSYLQNGEILPGQMRWFHERAIMSAVPRNIIEEYMAFQHRTAKLEDHMIGSGGDSIARVLLYDVTQMITHGDLYDKSPKNPSEYDVLRSEASEQLVVSATVSAQIQNVVDEEVNLLHKKKVIFWEETPYVPPEVGTTLQPGDVNKDGKIGSGDIAQILAANKYERDVDAGWADGDVNGAPAYGFTVEGGVGPAGNRRVNSGDVIAILATNLFETGSYVTARPASPGDKVTVTYNPNDGNFSVRTTNPINSFQLESASAIFTANPAQNLGGLFDVDNDQKIFKATFGNQFSEVDFGQVASANLPEAFLREHLTANGSFAAGGMFGPEVELNYIPEPSSLALLALGLVGFVGCNRKCNRPRAKVA